MFNHGTVKLAVVSRRIVFLLKASLQFDIAQFNGIVDPSYPAENTLGIGVNNKNRRIIGVVQNRIPGFTSYAVEIQQITLLSAIETIGSMLLGSAPFFEETPAGLMRSSKVSGR
jgi:hypothetical protein